MRTNYFKWTTEHGLAASLKLSVKMLGYANIMKQHAVTSMQSTEYVWAMYLETEEGWRRRLLIHVLQWFLPPHNSPCFQLLQLLLQIKSKGLYQEVLTEIIWHNLMDQQPIRAMKHMTHQWQPSWLFMKMPQRRLVLYTDIQSTLSYFI